MQYCSNFGQNRPLPLRYRSQVGLSPLFRHPAVAYASAQAVLPLPLWFFLFDWANALFWLFGRVSAAGWNNYTFIARNARKSPQMHSNASNHQTGEKHKREMGFAHSQGSTTAGRFRTPPDTARIPTGQPRTPRPNQQPGDQKPKNAF